MAKKAPKKVVTGFLVESLAFRTARATLGLFMTIAPFSFYLYFGKYWSSLCPREESNLYLKLRSFLFYPLNYEGIPWGEKSPTIYHKNPALAILWIKGLTKCFSSL